MVCVKTCGDTTYQLFFHFVFRFISLYIYNWDETEKKQAIDST